MQPRVLFTTLIALGLFSGAASAAETDSGNNIIRFGIGFVVVDGNGVVNTGPVDAEGDIGLFLDYERRLIPWLGLDFQLLYDRPSFAYTSQVPKGGDSTARQPVDVLTGTAGVNFHVLPRSRFDLYLGAFGSYTKFDSSKHRFGSFGPVFSSTDTDYSYGAVVGFNVWQTGKVVGFHASIRYSTIDVSYTIWRPDLEGTSQPSFPYDPLVIQLGLGWRF